MVRACCQPSGLCRAEEGPPYNHKGRSFHTVVVEYFGGLSKVRMLSLKTRKTLLQHTHTNLCKQPLYNWDIGARLAPRGPEQRQLIHPVQNKCIMFDWFPLTTKALGKVLFIHVASGEPKLTNTCPNISFDANNHRIVLCQEKVFWSHPIRHKCICPHTKKLHVFQQSLQQQT